MSFLIPIAAIEGRADILQWLLEKFPGDVNESSPRGLVALHFAAMGDHVDAIDVLIAAGAEVDLPNSAHNTPLSVAIQCGHTASVAALLHHGACPQGVENGSTPLATAVAHDNDAAARLLVDAGADVNYGGPDRQSPLWSAVLRSRNDILAFFVEYGRADLEPIPPGVTPLGFAVSKRNDRAVRILLDGGAKILFVDFTMYIKNLYEDEEPSMDVLLTLIASAGDALPKMGDLTVLEYLLAHHQYFVNRNCLNLFYQVIAAMVAAGSRSWDLLPTPCPGLERALLEVYEATPDDLPQLFNRLEPTVQARIRAGLLAVHRATGGADLPSELPLRIIFQALE